MARVCVVSSSLLAREKNWTAGHYLVDEALLDELRKAEQHVKNARARLLRARQAVAANQARHRMLRADGFIRTVFWR